MKIYIIVGDSYTRKSSTIRALTGVRDNDNFTIQFQNGNIGTFRIRSTSLQEKGILPETSINEINQSNCNFAIICLRFDSIKNRPSYDVYLNAFQNNNWEIMPLVFFNRNPNNIEALVIPTRNTPSNEIANIIRNHWQFS